MIVKPTVNELLEHAENRFALVIATSKRARQIANEKREAQDNDETSPVTLAANEIANSKVRIYEKDDSKEEKEREEKNEEKDEEDDDEEEK